ncbi:MAG: hypothetical protein IPK79_12540 [Vampirovibrionales bacterium]|nr:hypothetical protein [Vampirovibrionales bacterium]
MTRCLHCQSRFCRTLERRWTLIPSDGSGGGGVALLLKRRCNRCRAIRFEAIAAPSFDARPSSAADWQDALKRLPSSAPAVVYGRLSVMISDYSKRVARPSDVAIGYLRRIAVAQHVSASAGKGIVS